ncbi:xanthine dehydrogenase family protein molybdopterin-binding subunit [Alloacidobacterium dinghuense]|uniref:Xanthine dehydrogenase family protein molybdopterin-binding subunit n=1 Tax=Alloacidobacterium dinghuense TaxID=2763107 RepID=A0A7G8BMU6_9BACT|nr:molybdopterin cofactor-binding domain-containing protein [Alloacidobacterium dinghuense]QNI33866.1 xanthine dehydrogenase family protein molybdopterin-binding subunit [Alloacidobacterium dinghuense]
MPTDELAVELAQHEIRERLHWFQLDRRDFLKLCGGGLLVCLGVVPVEAQEAGRSSREHELPKEVSAWLHIDKKSMVTVFTGKVEIGQNIRTSLAQLVAEELNVPFHSITMVMGDTDLTPWDMGTFGSRSTPTMGPQLRTMASTARQMLIEAAAKRWTADPATLTAADGKVCNPKTSQSLTYGEITLGEKLERTVSGDPPFIPASEWKIAGKPLPKANGRDFVTGKHQYPSDIVRPDLMFGKVLRPSGFNAALTSIETSAAEKMPQVKVIRDGDFVGVVAPDAWTADQAIAAVQAKWSIPSQISNQELFNYIRNNPDTEDAGPAHNNGSVAQAMATADVKLEQHYTVQYIAHAPLEPRAAVAEWNGDKLTVWTGTQRPFGVRDELAEAFRIPSTKVRVIMPDMGSGYGGKHTGECAIEAARLAKAAGKPVKVVWTREEEFTWAYFRPAGWIEIRSGVRHDGTLVAWEHHNFNSGPSGINTPYVVENQIIQFHAAKSPLRQGSYRGLAATANHFARESHMDELAHALNMDPLEFRMKNLKDPRLCAVFQAAADRFGWGRSKPAPGHGFGIAGGVEKGGYVATSVDLEVDAASKRVRLRRVVQAWESGAIVNPDGLRNQTMGAVVQAIGGALFEAIQFKDGRILNPHFAQYRVPRFSDIPEIDVVLIDRKDLPSAGAGETGIVGLAPAVGNAIFAATGTRLRSLPMANGGEFIS